jgi:hypothetical protein
MTSLVARHQYQIQGTLSVSDRLRSLGTLRRLSYVNGLAAFLAATGTLLKDFGEAMLRISERIKQATERIAQTTSPVRVFYLESSSQSKEEYVRAFPGPVAPAGLIAILKTLLKKGSIVVYGAQDFRR